MAALISESPIPTVLLSLASTSPLMPAEVAFCLFLNNIATTQLYTLSLHDALPISNGLIKQSSALRAGKSTGSMPPGSIPRRGEDRKSTRLNSSHTVNSYAVFCLKKKKQAHHLECHRSRLFDRLQTI